MAKHRKIALRRARDGDADTIADLHAASWQSVYRGHVHDRYLDSGLRNGRRRHWRATMAKAGGRDIVLIAELDGRPVGFIAVWVGQDPEAFIDNLHAHPTMKRRGIGRLMMQAAARLLVAMGKRRAYLWVLKDNLPARRFYRAIGGETTLYEFETFAATRVCHLRIEWRDLRRLASRR
jgi:ribosomal protein S18 acetylase RimI-like enzyme